MLGFLLPLDGDSCLPCGRCARQPRRVHLAPCAAARTPVPQRSSSSTATKLTAVLHINGRKTALWTVDSSGFGVLLIFSRFCHFGMCRRLSVLFDTGPSVALSRGLCVIDAPLPAPPPDPRLLQQVMRLPGLRRATHGNYSSRINLINSIL